MIKVGIIGAMDVEVEGFCHHMTGVILHQLCGLDFLPTEDFIFVVEDTNEPVYKIDKMFTQLFNIKSVKERIKGMVLGDFSNLDNKEHFDELIFEISNRYNLPTLSGLKFGHEKQKQTFPIGVSAILDTTKSYIKLYK